MEFMDNPYRTPNATEYMAHPIVASKGATLASIVLATIAYSYLTIWMLNSTPRDKSVGQLFLSVSPVFVVWVVSLLFAPRFAFISGIVSVIAQLLVAAIMIQRFGTTGLVLGLNLAITMIFALLTVQCWIGRTYWSYVIRDGNTDG